MTFWMVVLASAIGSFIGGLALFAAISLWFWFRNQ